MRTAILKYALGAGLCGVLAFGAAAGASQIRLAPVAPAEVAQFCIPSLDNPDAHRFYCRNEDGWSGPTGRAAFACVMQDMAGGAFPIPVYSPLACRIAVAAADGRH